jgi:chitin synthase
MLLSIPDFINFFYILAISSVILWSLLVNHNNDKFKVIYYGASTLIGVYGILVLALLFYNTVSIIQATSTTDIGDTGEFFIPLIYLRSLILFVVVGFALPIIWTFSFRKSIEMVTSLISYIYFSPTYITILQSFAFCRIDDLSWGTKGLDIDDPRG